MTSMTTPTMANQLAPSFSSIDETDFNFCWNVLAREEVLSVEESGEVVVRAAAGA
jgi:hypothetical protein